MVNCSNLIIKMSPRLVLGRENVPSVAEVVNRSLKADCTDFTHLFLLIIQILSFKKHDILRLKTKAEAVYFLFSQIVWVVFWEGACQNSFLWQNWFSSPTIIPPTYFTQFLTKRKRGCSVNLLSR